MPFAYSAVGSNTLGGIATGRYVTVTTCKESTRGGIRKGPLRGQHINGYVHDVWIIDLP